MPIWANLIPHLQWGAIILFALVAAAIGISAFQFRRARLAPYYILREAARRRGQRWLIVAVVALLVGLGLLYLGAHPPSLALATPSPLPPTAIAPTPAPVLSPTVTSFPLPTALASPSPTRRPTATPPFIPTPTPAYPLPETALSPLPGAVPAALEAQITFVTFALGEENGLPVDAGFEFQSGDFRVYFFYEYQEMDTGVAWTYAWYGEEEYLEGNTCLWGRAREGCPGVFGRSGDSYLYFRMPDGYEPGIYEVRVWIENRFQDSGQFIVR